MHTGSRSSGDREPRRRPGATAPPRSTFSSNANSGWPSFNWGWYAVDKPRRTLARHHRHRHRSVVGFDAIRPGDAVDFIGEVQTPGRLGFDSRRLISGGSDGTVRVWDLEKLDAAAGSLDLSGHESQLFNLVQSPDGHWLATVGADKTVRLWDLATRSPTAGAVLDSGHEQLGTRLAISPDSRWLVAGGIASTARLWHLDVDNPTATSVTLKENDQIMVPLSISPDSHWLVTSSWNNVIRWDLSSSDPSTAQIDLKGFEQGIGLAAFSHDSRWLVTGGYEGSRLWDMQVADPNEKSVVLHGGTGFVPTVAFSPNGKWMATGATDGIVRVWLMGETGISEGHHILPLMKGRSPTWRLRPMGCVWSRRAKTTWFGSGT